MKKPKNLLKKLVKNPTNPTKALRENVDILMDNYGYTLNDISEKADIPLETFKSFFYGKSDECRLSLAIKLARVFGISVDEICGAGTVNEEIKEHVDMYKTLPEYSKYLVKYFIEHQYGIYQRRAVEGKKVISVLQPQCVDTYLQTTNVTNELCIEHLDEKVKSKIRIGLRIPCEHYMPHYGPHDILLIAADREAQHGERCVIEIKNNLLIVEKKVHIKNGVKVNEYVSLMNGRFTVPANDIDYKIGYIVGFLNAQDGSWGIR